MSRLKPDNPVAVYDLRSFEDGLKTQFPFFTVTHAPPPRKRPSFEEAIEMLEEFVSVSSYKNILLYGMGQHSEWVLERISPSVRSKIRGCVVSERKVREWKSLRVHDVREPLGWNASEYLVLFSSQSYEGEMFKCFSGLYPNARCVGMYDPRNCCLPNSEMVDYLALFEPVTRDWEQGLIEWYTAIRPDILLILNPEREELKRFRERLSHKKECLWIEGNADMIQNAMLAVDTNDPVLLVHAARSRPKLLFLDPSLSGYSGHYFNYAENVLKAAEGKYCRQLFVNEAMQLPVSFAESWMPFFTFDYWGNDKWGFHRSSFSEGRSEFIDKIRQVFHNTELNREDLIFMPNVSGFELDCLREYIESGGSWGEASLNLFLRYPEELRGNVTGLLKSLFNYGCRIHLFTDTEELRRYHSDRLHVPVEVLPVPVAVRSDCFPVRNQADDLTSHLVISSLGDARFEKGYQWLPGLVRTIKELLPDASISFEIQTHTNGSDERVLQVTQELEAMVSSFPLVLHSKPLSDRAYRDLMERTDIFLCLYDPVIYRFRSSNIFCEALAQGKELLTLAGSSPSYLLDPRCEWIAADGTQVSTSLEWMIRNRAKSCQWADAYQLKYAGILTGEALIQQLRKIHAEC